MKRNNIDCWGRELYVSNWVTSSTSPKHSPKRTYEEAGLDDEYPEWGVMSPREENKAKESASAETANKVTSTVPPVCEMEPELMENKEIQNREKVFWDTQGPPIYRYSRNSSSFGDLLIC